MAVDLSEQISQLEKENWVDLQGLITCSTAYLSRATDLPNLNCLSISLLGRGSFNTVYKLTFDNDSQLAASLSNFGEKDFNPEAKRSEIETMKFVRESGLYPDLPVPKVYAWDTAFTNPACAPYVLMEVVPGTTLDHHRADDRLFGLDTFPPQQQVSIVESLAKLHASLSKPVPFNEIGSITVDGDGKHVVGPLMTTSQRCLGGPYKSTQDLWRAQLQEEILHALQEWCDIETDDLSSSFMEPHCTPQKFAELFQLLSSLIPCFHPPQPFLPLVLHHPDFALRNVLFDESSILSGQPKVTGLIDWGGAQILPLVFAARYPDDLMTTNNNPFTRPDHPDELWGSVPSDWTSFGDTSQWPVRFRNSGEPVNYVPRVRAMIRRFYLRTYFSSCFGEQLRSQHGDTNLARTTVFANAPYYLKFHELICGGWTNWVQHANWIRETWTRMRVAGHESKASDEIIIGPNVYRESVAGLVRDLGMPGEYPPEVRVCEDGPYTLL